MGASAAGWAPLHSPGSPGSVILCFGKQTDSMLFCCFYAPFSRWFGIGLGLISCLCVAGRIIGGDWQHAFGSLLFVMLLGLSVCVCTFAHTCVCICARALGWPFPQRYCEASLHLKVNQSRHNGSAGLGMLFFLFPLSQSLLSKAVVLCIVSETKTKLAGDSDPTELLASPSFRVKQVMFCITRLANKKTNHSNSLFKNS